MDDTAEYQNNWSVVKEIRVTEFDREARAKAWGEGT